MEDLRSGNDDPVADAFRQGLGTDRRPDYKDPMSDKYFGSEPPEWAEYAWYGRDGYENPKNEQGVVKPVECAQKRKEFFASEGVDVDPEPNILGDYAECAAVGAKGSGKAQPLDEPVLTPNGYVDMGDLAVGDEVIGSDGKPTRITAIHPRGEMDVYRITMNDGTTVRCSADHLWSVQTGSHKHRGSGFKVRSLKQLRGDLKTSQGYNKWYLPNHDPVKFGGEDDLPISPYALGALIGDGCFRTGGTPNMTSADPEIPTRIGFEVGSKASKGQGEYTYSFPGGKLGVNGHNDLRVDLEELDLWGCDSHDKFIPRSYLHASVMARKELMRGLMDTDGTVTSVGTATFCTVSEHLADDFVFLARSLGAVTKKNRRSTSGGCGYAFRVRLNLPFNPFWIGRKASKFNTDATQGRARSIESIEKVGREEVQCITVAAEDSLYLTTGFNVTHNSFTFGMASNARVQDYPGFKMAIVANSYDQAWGSGAEKLAKVARAMGLEFKVRGEMMIDDFKHRNVYYFPNFNSKVCVLSFDNIDLIEGTEWDGFWFEEIQDCDIEDIQTAVSRARRGVCAPFFYYAGMPDDKNHPMYDYFEERGIPIFEPSFYENEHNVEPTYAAQLKRNYRGTDVDRYLEGKRVALFKQEVIPDMNWSVHVDGRHSSVAHDGATLTEKLCSYDPYRKLILGIDFNVAPMCMSAWQVKEWDFANHVSHVQRMKPVICQVDEWELWNATTQGMMNAFLEDYQDHPGGGLIVGDATGNKRDTRSPSETDWTIIKKALSSVSSFGVLQGLVKQRSKRKKGRGESTITYSNPPVRETINILNNFMNDEDGDPRMLFLPDSGLESGGVPASVAAAEYDMTSKVDDTNDRSDDRSLPRTHFFDTARYIAYFANGRLIQPNAKTRGSMGGAEVEEKNTFSNEEDDKVRGVKGYLKNVGKSVFG